MDEIDEQDVTPRQYVRGIVNEVSAFLSSITRCPSDTISCALVETHITHEQALFQLRAALREITAGRESDHLFLQKCENAYNARRDLADVEIRQQLCEWMPSLYGLSSPN